ncbi:MAG: EF-hand domain-containing protein [Hyphomicrobium sp.]
MPSPNRRHDRTQSGPGWAGPALVIAALPALVLAGCSSTSPFKSASSLDVTFLSASQTWDLDKNGTITCDEWKQYAGGELRNADGDGDGALNATEWSQLSRSDRLFETADLAFFDSSGDGKVTAEEIAAKPNPAFKMLDRNGDCQIGYDEKATVYSNVKSKDTGSAAGASPAGQGPPGGIGSGRR